MADRRTPTKTIRLKCLDCSGGSHTEVKWCPVTDCPLWRWRFGRRPETVEAKTPELLDPAHVCQQNDRYADFIAASPSSGGGR